MSAGRRRKLIIAAVAAVLIVSVAVVFRRPVLLMSPKGTIESYLSRNLAPGTAKEQVIEFAQLHDMAVAADVRTTEERFLRIHLGHYRIVFRTDVVAFVRLDQQDRVTRIDVQKHTDSI